MGRCFKCGGSSFILKKNEVGEEVWSPCECRIKKDREMLLESKLTDANIKKKFRMYTFDDYLAMSFTKEIQDFNRPQVETLQKFINNPHEFMNNPYEFVRGPEDFNNNSEGSIISPEVFSKNPQTLWIWGEDSNAGHTTLSIILGIALIKAGYKVRFFKMQNLLDAFVEFDKKDAFFADLKKFDVYIIDDAFVKGRSIVSGQYTHAHLFNFIDTALGEDKHFIMTSDKLVEGISSEFEQIKMILKRSLLELELRGSIIETKQAEKTLSERTDALINKMKKG